MAREINRLTARKVASLSAPGRYADGQGLYLSISTNGGKRWVFLFKRAGKAREMGLGSALANAVSLAKARELASAARETVASGLDPIEERERLRAEQKEAPPSFRECARRYILANEAGWRNSKHGAQWSATLERYAYPVIGDLPVSAVKVGHVTRILEPIWSTKTETASRVRGRIESVLDWAKARGYRAGENPATWRGHLDKLLPARAKVRRVKHHPALPYAEAGAFMGDLRGCEGVGPFALEFTILSAARSNETIGALVREFDTAAKLWTIPEERMKGGREHKVPLSARALAIVKAMLAVHGGSPDPGAPLFIGQRRDRRLSNAAMSAVLERMGRDNITVHGFRSTFRDWAAECTNFPNEVVEQALAHVIANKAESAYRRGDLLKKRAALMAAWDGYCSKGGGSVLPLVRKAAE